MNAPLLLSLILPFSLMAYFLGHQTRHLLALRANPETKANPAFKLLMALQIWASIVFLIWYGYKSNWYSPFLLFATSFPIKILLTKIEALVGLNKRAWMISISGIFFAPLLLVLMIYLIKTVRP